MTNNPSSDTSDLYRDVADISNRVEYRISGTNTGSFIRSVTNYRGLMGEETGSLEDDLRELIGFIGSDLREEVRSGVRRLFDVIIESVGTPPLTAPSPSKTDEEKLAEAKDVTPSPPLKLESSTQ